MARKITLRELKPVDLGTLSGGKAVFISDLHLTERPSKTSHDIARFLRNLDAAYLFLLGDIFDFWFGNKHSRVPVYAEIISALKQCSDRGVKLFVLRGNRDFLAQDYLRRETGATTAGTALTFSIGRKRVLLTHGDAICTWDSRYAAWRRICSISIFAEIINALPLSLGRFAGRLARLGSTADVSFKPNCSLKFFETALTELYRDGIDVVVAGHIHDVGKRTRTVNGEKTLFVLGGWETGGCHLEMENGEFHLKKWDQPA